MPFRTWAVGEEVLAADFQAYLQDQVVATFANAAARDAAIVAPKNGQAAWLQDTKTLTVWDSAVWRASAPGVPATMGASSSPSGNTSSTAFVNLPGGNLTLTFPKLRADTALVCTISGHSQMDDALAVTEIAIDVDGADTVVDNVVQIAAGGLQTHAGTYRRTGLAAGNRVVTVQCRVTAAGNVLSMNGQWTLLVTETF